MKEMLIEEYFFFFVKKDIKMVVIVRDLRDIIIFFNVGSGVEYGGGYCFIFFYLRNWWKSIVIVNLL